MVNMNFNSFFATPPTNYTSIFVPFENNLFKRRCKILKIFFFYKFRVIFIYSFIYLDKKSFLMELPYLSIWVSEYIASSFSIFFGYPIYYFRMRNISIRIFLKIPHYNFGLGTIIIVGHIVI